MTCPAAHVAAGLGDTAEAERRFAATLWGEPALCRVAARPADGTMGAWRRGTLSVDRPRDIVFGERRAGGPRAARLS